MKNIKIILHFIFLFIICFQYQGKTQDFPFQDASLSEDERIDNFISLMTLEEKIDHLSPFLRGGISVGVGRKNVTGKMRIWQVNSP